MKLRLNLGKQLGGRFGLHKLSLRRPPFILIYKQCNLFLDNELNIATIQQKSNYCCYPIGPSLYYPNRELGPAYSFKADERGDGPEPAKDGGEGTREADIDLQLMTATLLQCNCFNSL